MKKLFALILLCLYASVSVYGEDWLEGVYVNQDKKSLMDEVIFCKDGKAYAGLMHRKYKITTKGDAKFVVLNSNGVFTFKISKDKQTLLPNDSFTKEWATKTSLKLDSKRKDKCNW